LGFGAYAELSLASKMAPNVEAVEALLEELRTPSWPAALRDLEDLRALSVAGVRGSSRSEEVALWDIEFLSERLREQRFQLSEEALRAYFPLEHVLEGLFALAKRIFGVVIERATEGVPTWHPDVRFFRVLAMDGTPIAAFYLDPYSRPENKRGG